MGQSSWKNGHICTVESKCTIFGVFGVLGVLGILAGLGREYCGVQRAEGSEHGDLDLGCCLCCVRWCFGNLCVLFILIKRLSGCLDHTFLATAVSVFDIPRRHCGPERAAVWRVAEGGVKDITGGCKRALIHIRGPSKMDWSIASREVVRN